MWKQRNNGLIMSSSESSFSFSRRRRTTMARHPPHVALVFLAVALLWVLAVIVYQYGLLVQQQQQSSTTTTTGFISPSLSSSWTSISQNGEPEPKVKTQPPPAHHLAAAGALIPRRFNTSALVKLEQSKQQQERVIDRSHYADNTFNGIPVTWQAGVTPASRVRCIHDQGLPETDSDDDAWQMRSCLYHNLCLNVDTHEYVIFTNQVGTQNDNNHNDTMPDVALGALNPRWTIRGFNRGIRKVRWAPTTMNISVPGYYALPDNYILIPFHSLAAHNIGHLLWDDFYPIFSLLYTFGLLLHNDHTKLLPLRHKISQPLYANCDIRANKRQQCAHNLDRFLPLLGVDPVHFSTTQKAVLQIILPAKDDPNRQSSPYVCAARGVAGLGMLQDHGWQDHGWNNDDDDDDDDDNHGHDRPHNLARGRTFQAFGDFLVQHVLGTTLTPPPLVVLTNENDGAVQVVVSTLSSRDADRRLDFAAQVQYLQQRVHFNDESNHNKHKPPTRIQVNAHSMWEYTLADQVRLARQAHIWITTCGGGVMTATFLPAGCTLIVYYNPTGGLDYRQQLQATGKPARLDWDLLNNASHLRVHWLPIATMNTPQDLELLASLVRYEAEVIVQRQHES